MTNGRTDTKSLAASSVSVGARFCPAMVPDVLP